MIDEENLIPTIEIDAELDFNEIDNNFYGVLKHFAPFGPGNMNPLFSSDNLLLRYSDLVGKEQNHLKLSLFHSQNERRIINAIAFGFGYLDDEIVQGLPLELIYSLEENSWKGRVQIQLHIKDIHF